VNTLVREYKGDGEYLSVHPDTPGTMDDAPDTAAWASHVEVSATFFLSDEGFHMAGLVLEGKLTCGVPMVNLDIITGAKPRNGEEPLVFRFTGIIDTGCPACIVNSGILPDYFFQEAVPSEQFLAFSGVFDGCRGAKMGLWFSEEWKDAFVVPVYEKPIGLYKRGEAYLLLGRSFLNFGTFTFDGPNQSWKWAYGSQ
jgi:hypothetical protein